MPTPPKPKDRRLGHRSTADRTVVELEAHEGGRPEIPGGQAAVDGNLWSPEAVEWWNTWASCEQAENFTATDWLRLKTLLPLVDLYYRKPTAAAMAEIRQNESALGA